MDAIYTATLLEMGSSLTSLAVKGTTSAINSKVKEIQLLGFNYKAAIGEPLDTFVGVRGYRKKEFRLRCS